MNLNLVTPTLGHIDSSAFLDMPDHLVFAHPKHEQLVIWAAREWMLRYPELPFTVVWASEEISDNRALSKVSEGRKLKGKAVYAGGQRVACPYIVPINSFYTTNRKLIYTDSCGAFVFSFVTEDDSFDVIYASAVTSASPCVNITAIALVPPQHMDTWSDFQDKCLNAVYRVERSNRVYIVGGSDDEFEPKVRWEDVILAESLKSDLLGDMTTFFEHGVELYKRLNLPAFRKLLLVGPPGTGKSSLCAALAKLALEQKYVVVYISASRKGQDGEGATFDKIQHGVRLATRSDYPVLLIVEEIDIYLKPEDKSQILNVLDGFESPNNKHGVLLIGTTNYPEVIDERISQRPGRIDRIVHIPEIQDADQAVRMLARYLGEQFHEDHTAVAPTLIGQTGAFVREASLYARMLALQRGTPEVSVEMLDQSIQRLRQQLAEATKLREKDKKESEKVAESA
ncbi:MAG: ATP-binding protein [Anaerolineae bacterium]|nr:ATP-binding protein [Anaerolineae bacterium]